MKTDKSNEQQDKYMRAALIQAQKAYQMDESPVGCVVVRDGVIIARGYNLRQTQQDVTKHAEMIALSKACKKLKTWHLEDCDLYVTLEPCYMCAGAIIQARIRHVYFGATDPKAGAVVSKNQLFDLEHNHHVDYSGGILDVECSTILKKFFKELRWKKKAHLESAK